MYEGHQKREEDRLSEIKAAAWYAEYLARTKKLPKLEEWLKPPQKPKRKAKQPGAAPAKWWGDHMDIARGKGLWVPD